MFCQCQCCMEEPCQCEGNCLNCWNIDTKAPECTYFTCKFSPQRTCKWQCVETPECLGCFCLKLVDPLFYCVKETKPCCSCFAPPPPPAPRKHISRSKTSNILSLLEKDIDKAIAQRLICPSCGQFYNQPSMLPCEHRICRPCVERFKAQSSASTDPCFYIKCPICQCTHYFQHNDFKLPNDYLRAIILKKYCTKRGISFPIGGGFSNIVYCQYCSSEKKREASMRCKTCKNQFFCHICVWKYHTQRMLENHNITEFVQRPEKAKHCFYHPQKFITEYCFDDKKLICEDCKFELHEDHNTMPLSQAFAEEARALFSSISKYKRVKYGLENDLLELNMLRTNFKTIKDSRKKEIRYGFQNLHAILIEQEKKMLENIDNTETEKQKRILAFLTKSVQIAYNMEGLMQYAKEALKEDNQIAFLQSAYTLVKEINDDAICIYQPDPCLRQEPINNLRLNFEQISSSLQILFPPVIGKCPKMENPETDQKYPYVSASGHDISVPKCIPTSQLVPCKSTASCKEVDIPEFPPDVGRDENNERARSLPPIVLPKSDICRFWQEYPPNAGNMKDWDYNSWSHSPSLENETESLHVPGQVTIYQTIAYPTAAKVFWTPPDDDVDSYDAEFHEVLPNAPEDCCVGDFTGRMSGIKQQSMELHNLSPSAEYLFRVRAVNISGKGDWSEVLKITTPPVLETPRKQPKTRFEHQRSENPLLIRIRNVLRSSN